VIAGIVDKVLAAQPDSVASYKAGKAKALDFIVGQVMRESRGRANIDVVKNLLKGLAVKATSNYSPAYKDYYEPNVTDHPYDPAKAKALLDAAGWVPGPDGIRRKNGQRLELQISYIGGQVIAQRLASLVQEEMRAIGIAITQKPYPTPVFFASQQAGGIINSGRYQIAYFGWISGVDPDDSSLYSCDQFPPVGQNDIFWCDPTLDQAEKDAIATVDQERARRGAAAAPGSLPPDAHRSRRRSRPLARRTAGAAEPGRAPRRRARRARRRRRPARANRRTHEAPDRHSPRDRIRARRLTPPHRPQIPPRPRRTALGLAAAVTARPPKSPLTASLSSRPRPEIHEVAQSDRS